MSEARRSRKSEVGSQKSGAGLLQPRDAVAGLTAYDPGHYEVEINLVANENPYDLPDDIKARVLAEAAGKKFNRYPDPSALELRTAIAGRYNVGLDNVVVGNGGDELLLALLLAYGGAGRTAVTFEPTFVMYAILSELTGTDCLRVARRPDFGLPEDASERVRAAGGNIVFVCSPNNPTGNLVAREELRPLLETGALVVVDEAYEEFSRSSVSDLLGEYRNLAILRTFSKAFSLAGLRVGYLLGDPEVIANVLKVKLPYNVNSLSQAAAVAVLSESERLSGVIDEIVGERERVFEALGRINGLTPYPSAANFILMRTAGSGADLWRNLLERGILVRYFEASPGLENCLRITIGTPDENDAVLRALGEMSQE